MSFYKAYAVAIGSLLTGAAVVHNIYKPDLVIYCNLSPLCYERVRLYTSARLSSRRFGPTWRHIFCSSRCCSFPALSKLSDQGTHITLWCKCRQSRSPRSQPRAILLSFLLHLRSHRGCPRTPQFTNNTCAAKVKLTCSNGSCARIHSRQCIRHICRRDSCEVFSRVRGYVGPGATVATNFLQSFICAKRAQDLQTPRHLMLSSIALSAKLIPCKLPAF